MKNRTDRLTRWAAGPVCGLAATLLFALYNGALGLWYASVWHGSICAYYLLLSVLRGLLLAAERGAGPSGRGQGKLLVASAAALVLMDLALAVPVSLMVLDRRPVRMGLIPAIASATYTTYKVAAAAVKLRRPGGSVFLRGLDLLRFVDALVSVLVLQNTLLTAVDGAVTAEMLPLVAVTSAAILLAVFALSVLWLAGTVRRARGEKITP